jgi:hypothetical protein
MAPTQPVNRTNVDIWTSWKLVGITYTLFEKGNHISRLWMGNVRCQVQYLRVPKPTVSPCILCTTSVIPKLRSAAPQEDHIKYSIGPAEPSQLKKLTIENLTRVHYFPSYRIRKAKRGPRRKKSGNPCIT